MKWTVPGLVFVLVFARILTAEAERPVPPGELVIAGGGAIPDSILRAFIDRTGGPEAQLLIVPQASGEPDAGKAQAEAFGRLGSKRVSLLVLDEGANRARSAIESADAIWFGGGMQNRLMDRLEAAGLVDLIRERHRSGIPMGGTSAGAAVMSETMIAGSDLPLDRGLGLWPEVIVDQHFVARSRFHRSLSAVQDHPKLLGVGIDEGTAVIVNPTARTAAVIGTGTVTIIDARSADAEGQGMGSEKSWRDIRVGWLREGANFSW